MSKIPLERQQQILSWLEQEKSLKIRDISNRLNVSEMTVYRDVKPLIDDEKVMKTSGGIAIVNHSPELAQGICQYCFKESKTRLSVQIITKQQQVEHTCCPHCGLLRYDDIKEEVAQIICTDFLQDTTISAKMATFLLNADINLNCCVPQVITFGSRKQAKQFQSGFGGELYDFQGAIQEIKKQMAHGCQCDDHQ
ncbi:DeoR family transcriptional regulator [Guptibacillus hwajinpoensis]|uniref:DeoR family transcriptional regulator n=1 Tax=Guptibacillus hwajinpoensis TaxID=208199 RepID=UPI001CFEE014|nr:DeoR family transcriptional regulator [Pseudalkalibacillus hwajinpoensis]WLR60997.1 DeoR family transcriptional regulator [Pseudalkalibacillus hwajinpoensis]